MRWAAITGLVAVAAAGVAVWLPAAAGALIVGSLAGCALWKLSGMVGGRRLRRWTIGAFGLYAAIGGAIWANPGLADTITSDALAYHATAAQIVESWRGEMVAIRLPGAGKEGFVYTLAWLYRLFGVHPAVGLVFNAALIAACIPVTFDTTRRLFGDRAARRVPWLFVLLPGFLVWGTQLHREQGVYLLLAVATNAAVRLADRRTLRRWLLFVLPIVGLMTFRRYVAFVYMAAAAAGLFVATRRSRLGRRSVLAIYAATGFIVLTVGSSLLAAALADDLARANDVLRFTSATANTGFVSEANIGSVGGALRHLPGGLARLLLGPLPGQVDGAGALPTLADTASWWCVLFLTWRGWRRAQRSVAVLLTPAAGLAAVFALIIGNYGMVLRHRTQLLLLLVPLVAVGLGRLRPVVRLVAPEAHADERGVVGERVARRRPVALHADVE